MKDEAFRPAPSLVRALSGDPIRVGSANGAKLGAVRDALRSFAEKPDDVVIVSVDVDSGVAEQPVGWEPIIAGARNRARAAFASGPCALAVGIEDGLVQIGDEASPSPIPALCDGIFNVGCAWITDGTLEGHGFSSGFAYPPGCLEPAIRDHAPIGALFDALWETRLGAAQRAAETGASGRKGGNIGRLTDGRLVRSAYGAQAVVCALVRFLHTDLYD